MEYEKELCPVCLKEFADGDDIVVCPECGTPHHRECWSFENRCANEALHKDGFEWHKSNIEAPKPEEQEAPSFQQNSESNSEPNTNAPFSMPVMDAQNITEDGFESLCMRGVNANKDDRLDGMRIGDIAFYIQQSARNYINKFLKGKKLTFNWAALFFSPAWFFYRKLYKAGAIFLALSVAVSLFTYPLVTNLMNEQEEIMSLVQSETGEENPSYEAFAKVAENQKVMAKVKSYMKRSTVVIAADFIPHLIAALCANEIYKRKIKSNLEIINSVTEDKTAKRMLLIQRGGVSFLWGAIVFIAADYIVPALMSVGKFFMDLF